MLFFSHVFLRRSPCKGYNGRSPKLFLRYWRGPTIFLYQSASLALLRPPFSTFLTAPSCFQPRLTQTLRSLGYNPGHLVLQRLLLQALSRLGYNWRHLVFQPRLTQTLRSFGYNPGHLVLQRLLLQALSRLGYNWRHLVFQPRLPNALPRQRFQPPQP